MTSAFRSPILRPLRHALSARAATVLLASALVGQSPLVTTYASNNGGAVGGQVFFDLNVLSLTGITIKSLDVNLSAASVAGTINLLTVAAASYTAGLNSTTAASWTGPGGTGPVVAQGLDKPSHVCFPGGVFLPFGVHGVAIQYVGVAARYTNGPALPLPPVAMPGTWELTLSYGAAQNVPFVGLFTPRIWNGAIHYDVGATTPCATCADKVAYGAPCASPCAPFPLLTVDANYPVLGEPLEIVTTGASPCAVLGFTMIGFAPTIPTAVLLPPFTCFQHVAPAVHWMSTVTAGSWNSTLALPNGGSLCGMQLFVQSATFEVPWSVVTSNGLQLILGS